MVISQPSCTSCEYSCSPALCWRQAPGPSEISVGLPFPHTPCWPGCSLPNNQDRAAESSSRRLLEEHHANSRTHLHRPPARSSPGAQPRAAPRSCPPANRPIYAPSAISAKLGNDAGLESPLPRPATSCCLEAAGCVRMLAARSPSHPQGYPGTPRGWSCHREPHQQDGSSNEQPQR